MSDGNGDKENKLYTILSGGAIVTLGRFVALGLGFLIQIVMARYLTKGAYGEVVLAIAIVTFVGIIAKLGLDDGLLHQFPKFEDRPRKVNGIVRAVFFLSVVSGTFFALGLFVLAPILSADIFNNQSMSPLLKIVAVAVPFITLREVAVALARSKENARVHAIVDQLAFPVIKFILVTVLVISGFGAVGAAVGHVVGYVFAAIVVILLIYGILLEYNQSHESMYRPVLLFSIPLLAVQGMNTIVSNIDIYMIGYFWDSSLVGEYNIALQLSNLFYPILMSLTFLLPPALARLNSEKKYEEMRHIYQIITKWVVALTLPLLLIFVLSPQPVIGILFGENYTGTATALQILAIGNFFSVSMGLVNASLIGLGNNRLVAYLVGFQFTMNAILDYLLIPELAATGAALATAAAIISNNAVGIVLMYRQYGVHPITSRWGYIVGSATVATIVLFAIIKLTNVPSFFAILIFLLSYPIIIIKLVVEPADEELLSLVENRIGKRLTPFRRLLKLLR